MNNHFAGWLGEQATAWGLTQGLDPKFYSRIDDIIIPDGRGGTTQLDHIIVSQFGLFVIEVKNRNGWIIGRPDLPRWRQISNHKTYEFQSPIAQNESHIQSLTRLLSLPRSAFHSIIYFCGDAMFQWPMPFNVRTEGITTVVRAHNIILLWPDEVNHSWRTLWAWKNKGNQLRERHVRYVQSLQDHALENSRLVRSKKVPRLQR